MAHRALDVLDATLAGERPVERTIEEALAGLDDGDPDVEDELVADGSIESDEYASPEEAALLIRNIAPGRDRSNLSCHSPDPPMVTASARRARVA